MEISIGVWSNDDIDSLPAVDLTAQHGIIKSEIFGATKRTKCLTCRQTLDICQGHWGRIELPEPIVRPSLISMLNSVISKLCLHCGVKIPISSKDYNVLISVYPLSPFQSHTYKQVVERLRSQANNATKCKRCGTASHKMKLVNGIFSDGQTSIKHKDIFRLLQSIPFCLYPIFTTLKVPLSDLFFTSYPIAPIYLRSSVEFNGMQIESVISKLYQELLGKVSSYNTQAIQNTINELELSDNELPNSFFAKPFIGKYTLFRSLINSYSGDNTIRNVLNSNQSPSPDDGYFCREFYTSLTSKIYVNAYTLPLIEKLKGKIVNVKNGDRYLSPRVPIMLESGDYVEVTMKDLIDSGGYPNMISYRQPSLHKTSVVAQIIKYRNTSYCNGNTSTFSTTALPGINGDQDGDEFNSRLVTEITSQYEHQFLMRPRANLVNDSTGSLAYGLIQTEVLQFIKMIRKSGSEFYKDLLPHCLREATFETDTADEIMVFKKSRNLIKNVYQLASPRDGFRLFVGIASRVKQAMGKEKMGFMFREIREARDFVNSVEMKKNNDFEILQSDMIQLNKKGVIVDAKFVSERLSKMAASYEKDFKEWLSKEDILKNDYALISYANLKVNAKMLSEALVMQKSEAVADPSNFYFNRVASFYPSNSLDVAAFGVITGSYFNGLEMKNLMHTFGSGRKKVVITSVGTAIPGMISRNMMKTMEDMIINQFKFVTHYNLIIDTNYNFFKLPVSELFLIPTKQNSQTLFPIDLPFVLKNLKTLYPDNTKLLELSKQHSIINTFTRRISDEYLYSFGLVHEYLNDVLFEMEPLSAPSLQYILNLIETKYKLQPAVGFPVGAHTATTIGELLTQSSLSNFHTFKKAGDDISLDADAVNIDLIQFSKSKKSHIVSLHGDDIKLRLIRKQLELLTFDDLKFMMVRYSTNSFTFSLNLDFLDKFMLSASDIEDIVAMHINELSYVDKATISTEYYKHSLLVTVECVPTFVNLFLLSLRSISKGLYRCTMKPGMLIMEVDNLRSLASIDTTDISITVPPRLSHSPVNSYQALINSYSASGMHKLAYRSLALFQTRYGFPIGIRKYPTAGQPVISKLSHQRAYLDLQKAALIREPQGESVPSSILLGNVVKIGTGYFDVRLDLKHYVTAKHISDEKAVTQLVL